MIHGTSCVGSLEPVSNESFRHTALSTYKLSAFAGKDQVPNRTVRFHVGGCWWVGRQLLH